MKTIHDHPAIAATTLRYVEEIAGMLPDQELATLHGHIAAILDIRAVKPTSYEGPSFIDVTIPLDPLRPRAHTKARITDVLSGTQNTTRNAKAKHTHILPILGADPKPRKHA